MTCVYILYIFLKPLKYIQMQILTKKQETVLQVVKTHLEENGCAPTLSELQSELLTYGMGVKSKRGVVQYLEALEKKGYIMRTSEDRGIKLVENIESENFVDIPLVGTANAGAAVAFAEENVQGYLKASKKLLRTTQNIFALEISGDSMNKCIVDGKYIEDGDFVVIDKNATNVQNNEIILAIVDGCATIKRFKRTLMGEVVLLPDSSNPIHQPIYIHESDSFFINGKVINVLKAAKNI